MLLQADPGLAEPPGFSTEQLASLSRSIELKKQRLEADIHEYITKKQRELAQYEQELLAQYRSIDCPKSLEPANSTLAQITEDALETKNTEEKAKRTKHTRVHKREKELFGLVTPIFLPLLEAGQSTPAKKEKKKRPNEEIGMSAGVSPPGSEQGSPSRDGEKGNEGRRARSKRSERTEHLENANSHVARDDQTSEPTKKSKRPAMKKSSLRNSGEKSRRKRVSLVIDDQIVLPADHIPEPPLTSPSETTSSSTSNSTASLDDAIDPRLMSQQDPQIREHQDPVHHSLPSPSPLPSATPTKHVGHYLPESPVISPIATSPVDSHGSPMQYSPPKTTGRTFLDPSPMSNNINIPRYASSAPIYASAPSLADAPGEEFSTYVGGIDGSGVTDVDQSGSVGYPSSLGASYMERYMHQRPDSVRATFADKAHLREDEKAMLFQTQRRTGQDDLDMESERVLTVDDEEFMGGMEDF